MQHEKLEDRSSLKVQRVKNKFSFLVVSKEAWAQPRRARKQLLFEALLRQSLTDEVFYIDPPRHFWQQPGKTQDMPADMRGWQASFLLPGERFSWVRAINRCFVARMLNKRISSAKRWCSVLYHPWDVELIPYLKQHGPVLFDWTEDWSVFHRNEKMRKAQERCVRSATAVLTVTEELARQASNLRGSGKDVLLLPNATALPLLDDHTLLPPPDDIAAIPEPCIGYAGHMGPWFDSDTLVGLAMHKPNWHWVLVGHADHEIAVRLQALPNVHMVGQKPLSQLQSYLARCQVLAAPYLPGISGDASKLYDYLTIGRPIVSSDIETARRLGQCVKIAKTTEQWIQAISEGVSADRPEDRAVRRDAAIDNSWPVRAKALTDWLASNDDIR